MRWFARAGRLAVSAAATLALFAGLVVVPAPRAEALTHRELALHWAPVHRQDTDNDDADADWISAVDFDGDWLASNNWEHQDRPATHQQDLGRLKGAAYYSVAGTRTHWFVLYAYYHPRDWCDTPLCEQTNQYHENDLEGALLVVRKSGGYGTVEGMVTVAHSDFWSYVPESSPFRSGRESVDGLLRTQPHGGNANRPVTIQEAKGHGLKAWDGGPFPGGDGVRYVPTDGAGISPAGGRDSVPYELIDMFGPRGLWTHRDNEGTFAEPGVFRGDNGKPNAANAPWRWDDHDDGSDLPGGELARDPAKLVALYFSGVGDFARDYLSNGYG
jgi:hypothetical protein